MTVHLGRLGIGLWGVAAIFVVGAMVRNLASGAVTTPDVIPAAIQVSTGHFLRLSGSEKDQQIGNPRAGTQVFRGLGVQSRVPFPLYLLKDIKLAKAARRSMVAWVDLRRSDIFKEVRPRQATCIEYDVPGGTRLLLIQMQQMDGDEQHSKREPFASPLVYCAFSTGYFFQTLPIGTSFHRTELGGSYLLLASMGSASPTYRRLSDALEPELMLSPSPKPKGKATARNVVAPSPVAVE